MSLRLSMMSQSRPARVYQVQSERGGHAVFRIKESNACYRHKETAPERMLC